MALSASALLTVRFRTTFLPRHSNSSPNCYTVAILNGVGGRALSGYLNGRCEAVDSDTFIISGLLT